MTTRKPGRPTVSDLTSDEVQAWLRAHPRATGLDAVAALRPDAPVGPGRKAAVRYAASVRRELVLAGELPPLRSGNQAKHAVPRDGDEAPAPVATFTAPAVAAPAPGDLLSLSPAESLAWTIRRLETALREADPGSAAYVSAAAQMQKALDRYHELRRGEEKPAATAADLSPAEWAEKLDGAARELTDGDLEVFVAEWLRRRRLVLRARQDGELEVVRAGARA